MYIYDDVSAELFLFLVSQIVQVMLILNSSGTQGLIHNKCCKMQIMKPFIVHFSCTFLSFSISPTSFYVIIVAVDSYCSMWSHTMTLTLGRAPVNKWSFRCRGLYLKQHKTQERNIRAPGGIRTRNPSKRTAIGIDPVFFTWYFSQYSLSCKDTLRVRTCTVWTVMSGPKILGWCLYWKEALIPSAENTNCCFENPSM